MNGIFTASGVYYANEILESEIVEAQVETPQKRITVPTKKTMKYLLDRTEQEDLAHDLHATHYPEEEEIEEQSDECMSIGNTSEENEYPPWSIQGLEPADVRLVTIYDEEYKSVKKEVSQQLIVGVRAYSENLSRFGTIDYIVFSNATIGCVVFEVDDDLFVLKELKNFLESPRVEKVTFNASRLSDALYHLANIQLRDPVHNEVANNDCHVMKLRSKDGLLPQKIRSIDDCLYYYLGADITEEHFKTQTPSEEIKALRHHPMTEATKNFIRKESAYLVDLKNASLAAYLNPLSDTAPVFYSILRDNSAAACRTLLQALDDYASPSTINPVCKSKAVDDLMEREIIASYSKSGTPSAVSTESDLGSLRSSPSSGIEGDRDKGIGRGRGGRGSRSRPVEDVKPVVLPALRSDREFNRPDNYVTVNGWPSIVSSSIADVQLLE